MIVLEAQDPARQHQVCVNAHATGPIATAARGGRALENTQSVWMHNESKHRVSVGMGRATLTVHSETSRRRAM
jgi:hypothetical protein